MCMDVVNLSELNVCRRWRCVFALYAYYLMCYVSATRRFGVNSLAGRLDSELQSCSSISDAAAAADNDDDDALNTSASVHALWDFG